MREWYRRISALVAGFDRLGMKPGDHMVTALQNNWQAATIHWACQFAGVIITPLNWRSTAEELDYCLANAEAKALVYEGVSAAAVKASSEAGKCRKIAVGVPGDVTFEALAAADAPDAQPRASAEAWSVMLYTSGTTAKPKGCRAASGPSGRRRWPMSRRISIARASGHSASCRSTTPWVCVRFWRCR